MKSIAERIAESDKQKTVRGITYYFKNNLLSTTSSERLNNVLWSLSKGVTIDHAMFFYFGSGSIYSNAVKRNINNWGMSAMEALVGNYGDFYGTDKVLQNMCTKFNVDYEEFTKRINEKYGTQTK